MRSRSHLLRGLHRALTLSGAVALAAVAPLVLPGAAGAAGASPSTSAASGTVTFTGDVLPGLSTFTSLGPAPAGQVVRVGVTLANPAAAAQDAAYKAIYTPGSSTYHHFLSAAEVAQQFGVPASTFAQVRTWATRDGMQAAFSPDTNEYLLLAGTATQAEKTFAVTIDDYTYKGQSFYANTAGPTVPAGLGIDGVIGLNSKLGAHTFDHKPPSSAPHGAAAPKPSQTMCAGGQCIGLTTPQDLWSIYDQPTDLSNSSADFGQGQQMAVLGEGAVSGVLADLRAFEKEHGLPQIRITIYPVGDTFTDTSGNGEWDIDMQASTGMSPKAYGETLYFANDLTDASVEGDFSAWGSDQGGPLQANASFGECEEDPTTAVTGGAIGASAMFTKASENTLQQATLQGKTLFSSTGDTGSSCPLVPVNVNGVGNEAFPETSYPASSPYVVGVGGTVLYGTPSTATAPASNSKRAEETAWTYTGGGNTFYIAEPAYQKGISLLDNQPCVSMPDGTPYAVGTPCRGIPDVAAQSGDVVSNGYDVTMGGVNDQAGAGTSLSSPLWMGMWTRVQAAAPADASGQYTLGFANPVLYKIGLNSTEDVKDFFDIGCGATSATCSGTGISPTTSNGYYDSLPRNAADASGWDYVSGLGAPDVTNLGKDATGNTTLAPTNPLTPPPPQDCGQPGLSPCTATCSPGGAVWTNPPHTATDTLGNKDPQLSLLEGAFKTSADGKTLQVLLTVTDLTKTVPTGAEADEWYMTWTYNKTEYFANAELTKVAAATGGNPTFSDGTVSGNMFTTIHTTDTGKFTLGPNGVVEIDVPLANVGSPPVGAILASPAGQTDILVGSPGGGTGLLEKVDSGGPMCDYTVGGGPAPVVPEAPLAVGLPLAAIAVLAGALALRRRRAAA